MNIFTRRRIMTALDGMTKCFQVECKKADEAIAKVEQLRAGYIELKEYFQSKQYTADTEKEGSIWRHAWEMVESMLEDKGGNS